MTSASTARAVHQEVDVGKLRALAVIARERAASLADVPRQAGSTPAQAQGDQKSEIAARPSITREAQLPE